MSPTGTWSRGEAAENCLDLGRTTQNLAKLPKIGQNYPDLGRTQPGDAVGLCSLSVALHIWESLGIFLPSMISSEVPIPMEGILFPSGSVPAQTAAVCLGVPELHPGFRVVNIKVDH